MCINVSQYFSSYQLIFTPLLVFLLTKSGILKTKSTLPQYSIDYRTLNGVTNDAVSAEAGQTKKLPNEKPLFFHSQHFKFQRLKKLP